MHCNPPEAIFWTRLSEASDEADVGTVSRAHWSNGSLTIFDFFRRGLSGNVLISYPKSGRTWVRYALKLAGTDFKHNHGGYATRDPNQVGYKFEGVRPKCFGERNIFLHRNPIDTAVSEFYQVRNRIFNTAHPKFDEMEARLESEGLMPPEDIDAFVLHPIWGCRKVCSFNKAHIEYFASRKRSKIARYEELRENPREGFSELLDFFETKSYDIDRIVEASSFDSMKQFELSSDPETRRKHALYGMKNNDENSLKVRRGKVKGYLDTIKPETVDAARRICLEYSFKA